ELPLVLHGRVAADALDAGVPHQVECEPEIERDCEIPAGQEACREPPVRHDRRRRGHHEADADRSEKPGPGTYDPEQERRTAAPRIPAAHISSSVGRGWTS